MMEAREGEQLGVEYADVSTSPSRAYLSMCGVGLPTVTPPPLKPGSIQPTSSRRKTRKFGGRPCLAFALASFSIASFSCLGWTITGSMFGAIWVGLTVMNWLGWS